MKEGEYIDIVLMRGAEGEPILGIAPAWSDIGLGSSGEVEIEGNPYKAMVESVCTTDYKGGVYEFAAKCFGADPERAKVRGKLIFKELNWRGIE